ncbi:MAG: methionine adenosyltransferase [Lachnospiraceae bacterium]|nr:methionine adenosyltransferase [Lachnospiraceae bacterium]
MEIRLMTSESVTEGHPDKICDQIADKILDELLTQDPDSRCACEVTVEPGAVHVMGEITTNATVNYEECARNVIRNIGYTKDEYGFTDSCLFSSTLHKQSPDIACGVDCALEQAQNGEENIGAGDQGMMFGYACRDTSSYMPLAISLANSLTMNLTLLRKNKILPYLRPDGKAQVTVEYHDNQPARIVAVVVSTQHDPDISIEQLHEDIYSHLILPVLPPHLMDENTKLYINPTGQFVLGGPAADTGLTGRKIIADTYGGYAHHGGGAFSGKDCTKVDRSAAYMARYIAKNIVDAQVADTCEVQLSYAIGVANPTSVSVDTFGTGVISDNDLCEIIWKTFPLTPKGIIDFLQLRRPLYFKTSVYGHFGKPESELPWERRTHTNALRHEVQKYM